MPVPDAALIARKAEIVRALKRFMPGEGVIADDGALVPYESDGLSAYRQTPLAVVLPETTEQVSAILAWRWATGWGQPYAPSGWRFRDPWRRRRPAALTWCVQGPWRLTLPR